MKLTAETIKNNWDSLIEIVSETFEGERKEKLLEMYEHFKNRMIMAPASGTAHFHLCTPGGYVQHILNIVHYSKLFYQIWKDNGAFVDDYTTEELIFAALHHDLGKVGDMNEDNYLPNPSEWHIKNQGKTYVANPDLKFMSPPDRGIWILNQFNIKMTQNEYLGIKLTDGMYDEGNIQYLKSYSNDKKLKSNMQHILHQADMTTTRIEYEDWLRGNDDSDIKIKPKTKEAKIKDKQQVDNLKAKFDELFTT